MWCRPQWEYTYAEDDNELKVFDSFWRDIVYD